MIECDNCGQPLDGTRCRWLCPRCGMKINCCEGAALPPNPLRDDPQHGDYV